MSTFRAIAATSKTIIGLLEERSKDEFPNASFALYLASDFEKADRIDEGISLFLYRVAINGAIRNLPPRVGPDGQRYRPSLPVDLHYLITAWGKDAEMQQRLLGWSMRMLEDTPILPAGLLNYYVAEKDTFHPEETVELICDPLSLQDWTAVWDKLKPKIQTSVSYVARMIVIESNLALSEGRPVQTRLFEMAKGQTQ